MRSAAVLACFPILIAGCGTYTPREVADPSAITLKAALVDVADSLNEMRARTDSRDKFGLIPDEVTVTFNIAAHGTNTGKLNVTASGVPLGPATLGASAENTQVADSNRGNQIVIKLKNIATADLSKGNKTLVDRCFVINPPKDCPVIAIKPLTPG
ncbi:hypothetical protein MPL3356_350075 [Mesorhizobium plurifarium]|uniref:Lipoprotein n=1 Tax=Mesorhizobium plurifarium TaxID=69974 RepID=A0A090E3H6_MESPL|nr:hypothetical protein MPL3356_350075 [Mesorhizobium plurifarium]